MSTKASGIAIVTLTAFMAMSVLPLTPAQAGVRSSQTVLQQTNKQFISDAFDSWARGQGNFFQDVLAPDVNWRIEGSGPSAGMYNGVEDLMERAVRPFNARLTERVKPVSKTLWAEGDHVIVHWRGEGLARDGQPYVNNYVWIFRLENQRAVEVTAFLDLARFDDVLRRIPVDAAQ